MLLPASTSSECQDSWVDQSACRHEALAVVKDIMWVMKMGPWQLCDFSRCAFVWEWPHSFDSISVRGSCSHMLRVSRCCMRRRSAG